ncbi:CGNR zinc finger domain-containing protein [Actinacidiphila acididurans]|uniref:CGNR zinc finger domain-containing protein n=1 Tax=Actinacidiphila acididurans TaxID=2784346 RepID=A0ABS2TVK8_9ACTN|nr:CGNR zinc finger domain-containing protein [Actinacidiphila acididurans]MBM9507379.1 CGNR zinc finger domain-containing protein [Actinacidiphila acididurans]
MAKTTAHEERETAVPATAAALVGLLNSRDFLGLGDRLDGPETAAEALRPFGRPDEPAPAARLDLVRALRGDLLGLVTAEDPEDRAGHWAAFTGRTTSIAFAQDFSAPGAVALRQVGGDPVAGAITRAVADLVAAGNWSRIRLCANHECREAFYDTSRSRNRRWHSYEVCGNKANVAAYRARHA